ncbi:MAG: hypothetical protein AB7V16_08615 [Vulcanibacillus sp.]
MGKKIFIGALTLALGLGMVVTPALAFTNYTDFQQAQQTRAANGNGFGKYFAGSMHEVVADITGLTDDELYTLRLEGKTIAQIANDEGITTEDLTTTLTLAKISQVEQLFNEGTITEDQKDYMISQAEVRTLDKINRTETGNPGYGQGQGKAMRSNQDGDFLSGQGQSQGKGNGGGLGLNVTN